MQRNKQWDAIKGILIILVVIGHYKDGLLHDIIFLFHMPLFFAVSGFFYKYNRLNLSLILKYTRRYLLPSLTYFTISTVLFTRDVSLKYLLRFIWGGRWIPGVYWYSSCLFVVLLLFTYINRYVKCIEWKAMIIMCGGGLAVIESNYINKFAVLNIPGVPWNADVALMAMMYFAFAFFYKTKIDTFMHSNNECYDLMALGGSFLYGLLFILMQGNPEFGIDMKYVRYSDAMSAVSFPLLAGLIILRLSHYLAKNKYLLQVFSLVGKASIPIMYLHIPLNSIFKSNYSIYLYVIIGILPALVLNMFGVKNKVLMQLLGLKE